MLQRDTAAPSFIQISCLAASQTATATMGHSSASNFPDSHEVLQETDGSQFFTTGSSRIARPRLRDATQQLPMAIICLPQAVGVGSAHSPAHLHVICLALCCLQLRLQLLCSCSALLQPALVISVMVHSRMPVDRISGLERQTASAVCPETLLALSTA